MCQWEEKFTDDEAVMVVSGEQLKKMLESMSKIGGKYVVSINFGKSEVIMS